MSARTRREGSSLWKVPVAGGEETQVLPSLANDMAFAVTAEGIYFIPIDTIQFLRFSDGSITTVAKADRHSTPTAPRSSGCWPAAS